MGMPLLIFKRVEDFRKSPFYLLSPSCFNLIPIVCQFKLVSNFFHSSICRWLMLGIMVRPVAPVNAPVEEPTTRGRS